MKPEQFWKENDAYHRRQGDIGSVKNNQKFFNKIFDKTGLIGKIISVLELGAGEGRNIAALHGIYGCNLEYNSAEINEEAASKIPYGDRFIGSIYDCPLKADLVLTKGLLIHIPPEDLPKAYDVIYKASNEYILICEYYNPTPVMVPYRGQNDKLWKRDFAGELMDKYSLRLVDYGFAYNKDGQDDLTWFLMEKM